MENRFNIIIEKSSSRPGYFARCAEMHGPKGEGKTPEEAEANLTAALAGELESRRAKGVAEALPDASVTTVVVDEPYHAKAIRFEEDQILERARQILESRKQEAAGTPPPWKGTLHNEFTAIIEQDEGWYVASAPEIGGLGQGKTIADVLDNLADACALLLLVEREQGLQSASCEAIHKTIDLPARELSAAV